jgi:hypothetical protein
MNNSFLDVDFADESTTRLASRKAVVIAKQRVDNMFGAWLRTATNNTELAERVEYINDDLVGVVKHACSEFGATDSDSIVATIVESYAIVPASTEKTASVHESRQPKMCPFHKDVVDISLADGQARSGFDAMAQHWGGPKHCQGDGYEGSKCNFKPQMTTQAFWDEKAEKAEERKQQRAEQTEAIENAPLEETDGGDIVEPVAEITEDIAPVDSPVEEISDGSEGAEVIDFPSQEAPAAVEAEVPMAMAAKTADKDVTGLGATETPINKNKWTPSEVPFLDVDDADGRNPTKQIDIVEPIKPSNGEGHFNPSKLEEIGEQVTEHIDVTKSVENIKGDGTSTFPSGKQADPVTSAAQDVNRNPITDLLENGYEGFVPEDTVQRAIAAYRK